MFQLFVEGGPVFMTILTILLAGLFFAAWKAPRWVREIGAFALVFGLFSLLLGWRQAFDVLEQTEGSIAPRLLFAGLKVTLIPVLYGMIIYMVSLVIRVIQKPKL